MADQYALDRNGGQIPGRLIRGLFWIVLAIAPALLLLPTLVRGFAELSKLRGAVAISYSLLAVEAFALPAYHHTLVAILFLSALCVILAALMVASSKTFTWLVHRTATDDASRESHDSSGMVPSRTRPFLGSLRVYVAVHFVGALCLFVAGVAISRNIVLAPNAIEEYLIEVVNSRADLVRARVVTTTLGFHSTPRAFDVFIVNGTSGESVGGSSPVWTGINLRPIRLRIDSDRVVVEAVYDEAGRGAVAAAQLWQRRLVSTILLDSQVHEK